MRVSRFTLLLLALLVLSLGPQTVSGHTWWQDHFTADTSANYDGQVTHFTWNTALTTGWLNVTTFGGGVYHPLHYKNEKFGPGWYNWTRTDYGTGSWAWYIWGDESASDMGPGGPYSGGTKYLCRFWPASWYLVGCGEIIADVYSEDITCSYTPDYNYNFSVHWVPGDIKFYVDNVWCQEWNNDQITNPGYMGISYYSPADQNAGYDIWEYSNETSPPPTPTPTPTPPPVPPPQGVNTSPWVYAALPNQHGMDDLPVFNLSFVGADLAIGNIEFPPIYEANSDVIPWEIWILFLVIGVLGAFGAFVYSKPEGQVIAGIFGLTFSGYAFILSSMIGVQDIATNPQMWEVTVGQTLYWVMPLVVQPVYTVYNPPWLWTFMLALVFAGIAGFANGVYNLVMKSARKGGRR